MLFTEHKLSGHSAQLGKCLAVLPVLMLVALHQGLQFAEVFALHSGQATHGELAAQGGSAFIGGAAAERGERAESPQPGDGGGHFKSGFAGGCAGHGQRRRFQLSLE